MALTLLSYVFALLLACLLATIFSALYLFMYGIKDINEALKHPYLTTLPWHRLSLSNKTGILLDYFFRLFFPSASKGLMGHANRQLAHVNPDTVPLRIKAPILGLWGGCFLGIIVMIVIWVLVLIVQN